MEGSLHGGRHGAGIENILAQVGPFIDSGDDQVGPARQEVIQSQDDGIHRRAIHRVAVRTKPLITYGAVQGDGMADGAHGIPWRDHGHVAEIGKGGLQSGDPL